MGRRLAKQVITRQHCQPANGHDQQKVYNTSDAKHIKRNARLWIIKQVSSANTSSLDNQ